MPQAFRLMPRAHTLRLYTCALDTHVQCGACGFGPVDYTGCANLESHHNQRLVAQVYPHQPLHPTPQSLITQRPNSKPKTLNATP